MRKTLLTDPRVSKTSRTLRYERHAVIGALFHLWTIGDDHGGFLEGMDTDWLNTLIGVPGFAEALPPDWIEITPEGIRLPNYEAHNGTTAKKRAQAANRQQTLRDKDASRNERDERNADSVTREDKSREEVKKKTNQKKNRQKKIHKDYPDDFEKVWEFWPPNHKGGKSNGLTAWNKLDDRQKHLVTEHAELLRAIYDHKTADPDACRITPHLSTWINGGHWDRDSMEYQRALCSHYKVKL